MRQPTWTAELAERVLSLRQQYPRWGKDKLAVLLRRERLPVSTSMVGRILVDLNGQLLRWEKTYNCVRPHQSLSYLTPLEFITRWKRNLRKAKCH